MCIRDSVQFVQGVQVRGSETLERCSVHVPIIRRRRTIWSYRSNSKAQHGSGEAQQRALANRTDSFDGVRSAPRPRGFPPSLKRALPNQGGRDRTEERTDVRGHVGEAARCTLDAVSLEIAAPLLRLPRVCLLYTSDAADDL